MTIYLDMLFLLNTVINYLLLRGSAALGGCAVQPWRLAAASLVGGIYAVITVLPAMEPAGHLTVQLVVAAAMLIIVFGWKKSTVKQGLFFFGISFFLSGSMMLLIRGTETECILWGMGIYYALSVPALLLMAGVSYGLAAVILHGCGYASGGNVVSVKLSLNGRQVYVRAMRDTGNTLSDPVTGKRVLIADWKILSQLVPEACLVKSDFLDPAGVIEKVAKACPALRLRLLSYAAVGVPSGMLPVVRCAAEMGKRVQMMPVAFSLVEVSPNGQFNALLGGMNS